MKSAVFFVVLVVLLRSMAFQANDWLVIRAKTMLPSFMHGWIGRKNLWCRNMELSPISIRLRFIYYPRQLAR
jgi:hypothetical protein